MCQIICTFKCHHNSIKRIIKFISNTRQKKKNNTDLLLRLPDVSALSGCTQRIPLSKNESNTFFFWSYVSTLDMSLCFGTFRPSSNETQEHAITSLFTAEETQQPEIRQCGVCMQACNLHFFDLLLKTCTCCTIILLVKRFLKGNQDTSRGPNNNK